MTIFRGRDPRAVQAARLARWVTGQAGGWGLPGTGVLRPPSAPIQQFTKIARLAIRPGEGTKTAVVPSSGVVQLVLGPDALITWYLTYIAIETTTGANDTSTCQISIGPYALGIVPSGTAYNGGGDTISLGGRAFKPGEFATLTWTGANHGDQAIATAYGVQDVLT